MNHYFTNNNIESNISKYKVEILNTSFNFFTDNGVFSKSKLDYGTRFLIETIYNKGISGDCLDVGCGYGVISIILSKITGANFKGVDINKRAIHLASMNKKENNVTNVEFLVSDCYENVEGKFDYIITNPPIRAGKEVIYNILFNAKNYLKEQGCLFIVARKDQGAKTMMRDLKDIYDVEVVDRDKGFFVIKCILR